MSKIIFFNIPATGHVNPSLPVIKAIVERGIEVLYVNTPELQTVIEATGARFIAYPNAKAISQRIANADTENLNKNAAMLIDTSNEIMPFVMQLIDSEKPDLIMYDSLAGWGKIAAQHYKIPTVSLLVTFAISLNAMPPIPAKTIVKILAQTLALIPRHLGQIWTSRRRYGFAPVSLLEALACLGDQNIVLTSKQFQPVGDSFGDNFHFVGAAIAPRLDDVSFPFEQLRNDVPKVYISLGTIAFKNTDFYRECFKAFHDYPAQFIVSVGKTTDIASLGQVPENFIVRNYVPQLTLLEKVDAFITHGGLNSVHEGLLNGLPLLVAPQQIEQALVAAQVEKFEAGIALRTRAPFTDISAAELRTGLSALLKSDVYAIKSAQLGKGLRDAGGASYAADLMELFLK